MTEQQQHLIRQYTVLELVDKVIELTRKVKELERYSMDRTEEINMRKTMRWVKKRDKEI